MEVLLLSIILKYKYCLQGSKCIRTYRRPITWGLLLCWLTNINSSSRSLIIFSPGLTFTIELLYISSSSVRGCAFVPGWRITEYQHRQQALPLPATLSQISLNSWQDRKRHFNSLAPVPYSSLKILLWHLLIFSFDTTHKVLQLQSKRKSECLNRGIVVC